MQFTTDGSAALESRIAADMDAIRTEVIARIDPKDLAGLVLGGGYGRGEGGVCIVAGEEHVYNDYDFFVIVPRISRSRRNALMAALAKVKQAMEPRCGIHVDFSPPMPQACLASLPYELMFMELKAGHHVVIGPADILSTMPDYNTAQPPLAECTRLLMNRGVGLLLARQILDRGNSFDQTDREFVIRNIRKAQLAMGDALLFVQGNYHPSYIERKIRISTISMPQVPHEKQLKQDYEEAIAFKMRPMHEQQSRESLKEWHQSVTQGFEDVFLWFEQHRLSDSTLTWESYQRRKRRLPTTSANDLLKNIIRNIRIKTVSRPRVRDLILHPRDRILARLPALLFHSTNDQHALADIILIWEYCG